MVAFEKHTINSLNHYLSKYLDGKFAPRAAEALDELYWQRAKSHHTPLGYRKYLVTCPNGKYYEQAKAEAGKFVDTLDEESIEEALSEESKIHPPVPPADDEKAWIETKALNTFIAYQNFTKAYNHSKHLTEANRLMNHLDKVNSNLINIEFMSVNNLTDTKSNRPKKEKIKLLEDLINKCKAYYIKFPAAPNNRQVAEIRNKLQIRLLGLIK